MVESKTKQASNREVKSSAFTAHFSDPKNAAQLYSALEGVEVSPENIHYATLEGILFISRRNDLAFTAENKVLVISEHQSTVNENMPIRDAIYYGRTMEKLINNTQDIYRKKRVMIPTPKFYVFYNGSDEFPAEKYLKLSDSYLEKDSEHMLELIVKVININLPNKHRILEQCRPLYEYSWFIQKIKDYLNQGMQRDEATIQAIRDCKREGIMADFMDRHGAEAQNMLFGEFDEEIAREVWYEEGFEDGQIKALQSLMDSMNMSLEQAMNALKIPQDEREKYLMELQNLKN